MTWHSPFFNRSKFSKWVSHHPYWDNWKNWSYFLNSSCSKMLGSVGAGKRGSYCWNGVFIIYFCHSCKFCARCENMRRRGFQTQIAFREIKILLKPWQMIPMIPLYASSVVKHCLALTDFHFQHVEFTCCTIVFSWKGLLSRESISRKGLKRPKLAQIIKGLWFFYLWVTPETFFGRPFSLVLSFKPLGLIRITKRAFPK